VVVVVVVVVVATVVALATLSVTSVGSSVISPVTVLVEHQAKAMVVVVLVVGVMVGGGHNNQIRPVLHVVDMVTCHGTVHRARSVTTVEKSAT